MRVLLWLAAAAALGVLVASAAGAAPGGRLWAKYYDGPAHEEDLPYALGVSPDGSKVFVTGSSASTAGVGYGTIAYDAATGAKLWLKRLTVGQAYALGVSPDGSKVYVTGQAYADFSYKYATVAYDAATGAQLWIQRYSGPDDVFDSAQALSVSPDGSKVFVTGEGQSSDTAIDWATVAYDAATGAQLWVGRYNGSGDQSDYARALGVSPDSSTLFVTGSDINKHDHGEGVTIAYDAATGAEHWVKRDPSVGGSKLGVSPDGSKVFLTNYGGIAAVDAATGATLWLNQANQYPYLDLVVGPGGRRVFVTGYDWANYREFNTVAYDTGTGTELWRSTYDDARDDEGHALDISPDGSKLFVTGRSEGSNFDYLTIAYVGKTGAQLWAKRYNGKQGTQSIDSANAIGVAPDDSKVFVTGQTGWCDTGCGDYTTVAYSTG
jgi:hypothetical protein